MKNRGESAYSPQMGESWDMFAKVQLPQTSICFEQPLGWVDVAEELKTPTDSCCCVYPIKRNSSTTARWDSAKLVRPGVLQGIAELLAQGVSRHLAPIKQKMWCFKQEDNFCHQVDLKDRFALSLLTFQHEDPCMDEGPIMEMSMPMPCIHSQPTPTLTRIFYAHTDGKCHEASWCVTRMGICRSSYAGAQRPITHQPCRQTRLKRRLQQKSWK